MDNRQIKGTVLVETTITTIEAMTEEGRLEFFKRLNEEFCKECHAPTPDGKCYCHPAYDI